MQLRAVNRPIAARVVTPFPTIVFEMAAMPLPCNGNLLIQGNLPKVLPVLILKDAGCLIIIRSINTNSI